VIYLQNGFTGAEGYQPINSNHVIRCFDIESGEQVQVLRQGTQPAFNDRGYVQFTSSSSREFCEVSVLFEVWVRQTLTSYHRVCSFRS
jgi:hypothetical protein